MLLKLEIALSSKSLDTKLNDIYSDLVLVKGEFQKLVDICFVA